MIGFLRLLYRWFEQIEIDHLSGPFSDEAPGIFEVKETERTADDGSDAGRGGDPWNAGEMEADLEELMQHPMEPEDESEPSPAPAAAPPAWEQSAREPVSYTHLRAHET